MVTEGGGGVQRGIVVGVVKQRGYRKKRRREKAISIITNSSGEEK